MDRSIFIASIAVGLTWLACSLLSLSLRRHYQQVFADTSVYERRRGPLRLSGYGCLVLALWLFLHLSGPSLGLVQWISTASLGTFLQAMLLGLWF